jgi:hypothetical protein
MLVVAFVLPSELVALVAVWLRGLSRIERRLQRKR